MLTAFWTWTIVFPDESPLLMRSMSYVHFEGAIFSLWGHLARLVSLSVGKEVWPYYV
jgi:hypothetical protein